MRYKTGNTFFNKTVQLITQTYTTDDLGQQIPDKTVYRKIYCAKKSTPQTEFFLAGQNGIKPAAMFLVRTAEYKGEAELRYPANDSGTVYTIYRVYDTTDEMTELYGKVEIGNE